MKAAAFTPNDVITIIQSPFLLLYL